MKILAYIKKSFLVQISYKFAFLLRGFSAFAYLLTFYFIDKLFGFQIASHLEPYGVNYFSYVLVGIAFSGLLGTSVGSISNQISEEQTIGVFESLLATPTSNIVLIFSMVLWNFVYQFFEFALYVLLGIFLFKLNFSNINTLSVIVIMILSIVSFNSLGLIASGFIIIFKRGEPVSWFVNIAFELLGGVYFPVSVLPNFLQHISNLFPVRYTINAIELAVYKGAGLKALLPDIIALIVFSIILLPLGILCIEFALKKAKKDGTLLQY